MPCRSEYLRQVIRLDVAADAHHDITEDDFDRRACHRLNARELDLLLRGFRQGRNQPR
ncbi:hypothetical protein FB007_1587 [Sinorhizobium medicae]|nr:hypothetical protein FB007_1587 [Sinorhizobium medicae]